MNHSGAVLTEQPSEKSDREYVEGDQTKTETIARLIFPP